MGIWNDLQFHAIIKLISVCIWIFLHICKVFKTYRSAQSLKNLRNWKFWYLAFYDRKHCLFIQNVFSSTEWSFQYLLSTRDMEKAVNDSWKMEFWSILEISWKTKRRVKKNLFLALNWLSTTFSKLKKKKTYKNQKPKNRFMMIHEEWKDLKELKTGSQKLEQMREREKILNRTWKIGREVT